MALALALALAAISSVDAMVSEECFVAGTRILMGDGTEKVVEDIVAGDVVMTYDLETGALEPQLVTIIDSDWHTGQGDDFTIEISFSDGVASECTNHHAYYVPGKGYASWLPSRTASEYGLEVAKLEIGDPVLSIRDDGSIRVETITGVVEKREPVRTYNIMQVVDNYNFFADRKLVHNSGGGGGGGGGGGEPEPEPEPGEDPPPGPTPEETATDAAIGTADDLNTVMDGELTTASSGFPGVEVGASSGEAAILGAAEAAANAGIGSAQAASDGNLAAADSASGGSELASLTGTSSVGGDPVRLATGSYYLLETDLEYGYGALGVEATRLYESDCSISRSFGPGWSFSYDTRIVIGSDPSVAAERDAWQAAYEGIAASVAAATSRRAALRSKLNAGLALARDAYEAAIDARNAASTALAKAQAADGYRQSEAIALYQAALDAIAATLDMIEAIEAALDRLDDTEDELAALAASAAHARSRRDEAAKRADYASLADARNAYVLDPSDPSILSDTGNGTVTLIDERGSPHLYIARAEPDYGSPATLPNGWRNYYPTGTTFEPVVPTDERLELLSDGTFIRAFKDGREYRYGLDGQLATAVDRAGNELTFSYDASRRLTGIADGYGRTLVIERSGKRISELRDPAGRVASYSYDASERLVALTDISGDPIRYEYSGTLLTAIVKPDGSARRYEYETVDGKPRIARTVDEEGESERFHYYPEIRMTEYENASGVVERWYFDERLRNSRIVYADGSERSFEYDDRDNLVAETDELGRTTRYGYDDARNRVSVEDPEGRTTRVAYDSWGNPLYAVDSGGRRTDYSWDASGNLVRIDRPDGGSETFLYDAKGRVTMATDPLGRATEFEYDANGFVSRKLHPDGGAESFANDPIGRVLAYTDQAGQVWTYEYDAQGKIVAARDPLGRSARSEYDERKDLVLAVDRTGAATRNVYDDRHLLLASVDAAGVARGYEYRADGKVSAEKLGTATLKAGADGADLEDWSFAWERATSFEYDLRGRVVARSVDGTGERVEFTLDAAGQAVAAVDALGTVAEFEYDALGRVTEATLAGVRIGSRTYTETGMTATSVDANGVETRFRYDVMDRLAETGYYDDAGRYVYASFEYDAAGNLVAETDRLGRTMRHEYDALGRVVSDFGPDSAYGVSRTGYDPRGLVAVRTDRTGRSTRYEWNADRTLAREIDPAGAVTSYRYDGEGRLVGVVDRTGASWGYELDGAGRLVAELDPYGRKTTLALDASGELVSVTDRTGAITRYTRDGAGHVTAIVDPTSRTTGFVYDAAGRLVEKRTGSSLVETFAYDALGRVAATAKGPERYSYEYDAMGKLVAEAAEGGARYRYEYDRAGRPVAETDRLGSRATYRYDAEGNLVGKTDFDGSVTSYAYDGLDRLARVAYPDGTMKTFAWDAEGRLVAAENPGALLEYAYDPAGRLAWSRDGSLGEELRYRYDAEGRRTALERGYDRTEWRYGLAGELLSLADARGDKTSYAYDAELRETARTLPNGVTTETRYDAAGRIVALIHATREWGHEKVLPSEAYVYDDAGRKSLAVDASGRVTGYRYDAAGRLVEAAYPLTPGIAQEAFEERLSLGLFPAFEEAKPGKGLKGQSFATPELPGVDAEALKGFASRFEAWKGKLPSSDHSGAWKQSVDAAYLSRSTSMFENAEALCEAYGLLGARGLPQTGTPVWRETYAYDARGNRLEKRNALGAIAYAYDAENRLESAGARTYGYDANGSLVTETLSSLSVSYRYDAERRLVASSATDPLVLGKNHGASSRTAVSYAYDALGRRNSRTESGATGKAATTTAERTLYDGLSFDALAVYVDRDGRAAGRFGRPELAAEYLRANGVLVSSYAFLEAKDGEWRPSPARGAERYYLTDTLGSVRTSLDGRGHVEEVFRYDAFGSMYEGSTDPVSRFAYTGKPLDAATGRYDYGFRDYDPRTGRFQTVDPIRDGENWYGYVGNDPINLIDLLGLSDVGASIAETISLEEGIARATGRWPVTADLTPDSITSDYGPRVSPIDGTEQFHASIDISVPVGTPVVAAGSGSIVAIGTSATYGNYIGISYGGGVVAFSSHLQDNSIIVVIGQSVVEGQQVASSGNTGNSTGPHVDYMVRIDGETTPFYADSTETIDPLPNLPSLEAIEQPIEEAGDYQPGR